MHRRTFRRALAGATLIVILLAASAAARTPVEQQLLARQRAGQHMTVVTHRMRERLAATQTRRLRPVLRRLVAVSDPGLLRLSPLQARPEISAAIARLRTIHRRATRRIGHLRDRWYEADDWLHTYALFRVCPVPEYTLIHDDFGEMVRLPHVPPHRHMGSDVEAPIGTPILAPFDGYAWGTSSKLGGHNVYVRGDVGYVFNAHLSAYGSLGDVTAGDVIGYIGMTGDATAPHDHFEWHPWGGAAQEPYPYLVLACVDA